MQFHVTGHHNTVQEYEWLCWSQWRQTAHCGIRLYMKRTMCQWYALCKDQQATMGVTRYGGVFGFHSICI